MRMRGFWVLGVKEQNGNNKVERIGGVTFHMRVAVLFSLHQVSPWVPQKVQIFEFLE